METIRSTNSGSAKNTSSWIQLGFFTAFLFLLVAIPYTLYLKSSAPKTSIHITNLPSVSITPPFHVSLPSPSTITSCTKVPDTFSFASLPQATPTAYLIESKTKQVCFPPSLPPFPFLWKTYTDYVHGYSIDIPSNWDETTDTTSNVHTYSIPHTGDTAQTSDTPSVSFAWMAGDDPYATDSSYFQYSVTENNQRIKIYTSKYDFLIALFPLQKGYFYLQTIFVDVRGHDSAFYAFEHMLESLKFL